MKRKSIRHMRQRSVFGGKASREGAFSKLTRNGVHATAKLHAIEKHVGIGWRAVEGGFS